MSIDRLQQEEQVQITWGYFPLHPETPVEGKSLAALFAGREDRLDGFYQQIKGLADELGLPYSKRSMTYNSRLAQELASWADTLEGGAELHRLLYRAYFVDNQNIGDQDVLLQLAGDANLDVAEARRVLDGRLFSEAVNADWQRAGQLGLSGVPTFVSGELYVVGHQAYETMLRFVNHLRSEQAPG